jgi:probable F420-dependent oxidoreductase
MSASLRFSVSVGRATDLDAHALGRYGALAERLGFVSLLLGDHVYTDGSHVLSITNLAVLAAATEQIRLGFCAYVLPLRDPRWAAKELAELDRISGGRLIAGLAAGSNEAEFGRFGIPFNERGDRLDEGIAVLKQIWSGEPVDFQGRFHQFSNVRLSPTPVQRPHPPIWIGSWTGNRRSAERVVFHAEGWQASGLHTSVGDFRKGWDQVQKAARAHGRDPDSIRRSYVNAITWMENDRGRAWETVNSGRVGLMAPPFKTTEELRLIGTPDDVIARLRQLAEAGVEEVAILPPATQPEQLEMFAREVMPAFG